MAKLKLIDDASKGILYILYEKDKPTAQMEVQMEVDVKGFASSTTAYGRFDGLIEAGLIDVHRKVGSTGKYLILTEKGKKVVEYLKKIDEVMEE